MRVLQRAEVGAGVVRLSAGVVLEVWEDGLDRATGLGEVRFRMCEGSFAGIEGRWVVEPHTFPLQPEQEAARLRFEALVEPGDRGGLRIPDALARAVVDELLPVNVGAVARRAEALHREALVLGPESAAAGQVTGNQLAARAPLHGASRPASAEGIAVRIEARHSDPRGLHNTADDFR